MLVHPDKEFRQSDKCKMIFLLNGRDSKQKLRFRNIRIFSEKNLNDFFFVPQNDCVLKHQNDQMFIFLYRLVFHNRFESTNCGKFLENTSLLFQVPSARLCQLWCDQNEECQYFTWWSEGMFQNICFHHKECTKLDFECVNCHAGPRSSGCPRRRNNGFNWN